MVDPVLHGSRNYHTWEGETIFVNNLYNELVFGVTLCGGVFPFFKFVKLVDDESIGSSNFHQMVNERFPVSFCLACHLIADELIALVHTSHVHVVVFHSRWEWDIDCCIFCPSLGCAILMSGVGCGHEGDSPCFANNCRQ